MEGLQTRTGNALADPMQQTPRRSPVLDEMSTLETRVAELEGMVARVEERLGSVLTPPVPTADTGIAKGQKTDLPLSPMAGHVGSLNDRLASCFVQLRRLEERLQI